VAVAATLLVGCGPVQYIGLVSMRASNALAQAELAGADQLAPYEYTMAREYYRKAREEAGFSAFENAAEYGRRCEEMAGLAQEAARASGGTIEIHRQAAAATGEPGR
jgi:hypothetical protein